MSSTKKKPAEEKSEVWRQRIPVWVMNGLRSLAKHDRRRINDYISIRLEDIVTKECGIPHAAPSTPQVPKVMTDAYTRQQQGAPKIPAPPKDAVREIAESEEGWEGSDPKRLLAGTKVTI